MFLYISQNKNEFKNVTKKDEACEPDNDFWYNYKYHQDIIILSLLE